MAQSENIPAGPYGVGIKIWFDRGAPRTTYEVHVPLDASDDVMRDALAKVKHLEDMAIAGLGPAETNNDSQIVSGIAAQAQGQRDWKDHPLKFGDYEGKTLREIIEVDAAWVQEFLSYVNHTGLRQAADELLREHVARSGGPVL